VYEKSKENSKLKISRSFGKKKIQKKRKEVRDGEEYCRLGSGDLCCTSTVIPAAGTVRKGKKNGRRGPSNATPKIDLLRTSQFTTKLSNRVHTPCAAAQKAIGGGGEGVRLRGRRTHEGERVEPNTQQSM